MRMYSRLSTQSTSTSCVVGFLAIVPVITQCPVIASRRASAAFEAWLCASAAGTTRHVRASANSTRRARIGFVLLVSERREWIDAGGAQRRQHRGDEHGWKHNRQHERVGQRIGALQPE